jgi:hypothetical protein
MLSDLGPDFINGEPLFGSLQFVVSDVENVLLKLDKSKVLGPDGVKPLLLSIYVAVLDLRLCLLFYRSLSTWCFFCHL